MTTKQESKSQFLLNKALELFPSGVNSPVRAFKAVGGGIPSLSVKLMGVS